MDLQSPFRASPQNVGTIIISGPPAGGKSTQCKLLLKRYGLTHISAGDLLRARQKLIPSLSKYMENGLLVPDDLVCSIVKERLAEQDCRDRGVLLDGFPRTRRQAEALQELGVDIEKVIVLEVPDKVVVNRISGRRVDPVSGEVYHITNNPPKKKEVLDRLITREDDTIEKIMRRLRAYHSNISAVKAFYMKKQICTVRADLNPAAVFDQIRYFLEGDMYWGCLIDRNINIRSYETSFESGGSLDMISVSRYFEHMVWLMRTRGALADIPIKDVHFVVRAYSSELQRALIPGLDLSLRIWIEYVGNSSVTLGFSARTNITKLKEALRFTGRYLNGQVYADEITFILEDREKDETIIEVARGTTTLVAVNPKTRKVVTVPFRNHYKHLVRHNGELESYTEKQRINRQTSEHRSSIIFARRAMELGKTDCKTFEMSWMVHPKDLSVDGALNVASCVSYLEMVRFAAERNQAYESNSSDRVESPENSGNKRRGKLQNCSKPCLLKIETISFARVGDLVRMKTWLMDEPTGLLRKAIAKNTLCIGFELYNMSLNDELILRGCQLVEVAKPKLDGPALQRASL